MQLIGESSPMCKGARSPFDEVIAVCRHAGFSPRIVNEPNFMATVLALVESALGISLVPRCVQLKPPRGHSRHRAEVRANSSVRDLA